MLSVRVNGVTIRMSVWFTLALAASSIVDRDNLIVSSIVFSSVHELFHLACMAILKFSVEGISVLPGRVVISSRDCERERRGILAVIAAGPVGNLVLGGLLQISGNKRLAALNMLIALFNLLPAKHLDGGRIVEILIKRRLSCESGDMIMLVISILCGTAIMVLGVRMLWTGKKNASLIVFGAYMIFSAFRV